MTRTDSLEDGRLTLGGPNVERIIGVLILLAGVALIVATREGPSIGVVIGVILMAFGFWLSYVMNEVTKVRRNRSKRQ